MLRLKVVGITDLIATIVVLPDCIDRRNLVIASEAKQSRAAGQRGRRTRDCFVAPPLAMTAQPEGRRIGLRPPSVSSATQRVGILLAPDLFRQRVAALGLSSRSARLSGMTKSRRWRSFLQSSENRRHADAGIVGKAAWPARRLSVELLEIAFDVSAEAGAVDRPVDDAGGGDPVAAQRRQKGQCPPAAMRHLGDQAGATW